MNDKYDPIKSKSKYKEQTSFQVKENKKKKKQEFFQADDKNKNQQRERDVYSTNSNEGGKKKEINKTKILIINSITLVVLLVIVFGNSSLLNINLSGANKYELENGNYQLTFRNNKVVVGEDTIPAGMYKVTVKDTEDSIVILDNEFPDNEREYNYIDDSKVKSILKNDYFFPHSYSLDEETGLSAYINLEDGQKTSIDKTYASRNSKIEFEKVDKIPELKTITESKIGEYTTNKPTIDVEFEKEKYSNNYKMESDIQVITIKDDKVLEYNIDYSGMEKTEYTYDEREETVEKNKNEYYNLNDIVDKSSDTITLDLLDNTYIFVN